MKIRCKVMLIAIAALMSAATCCAAASLFVMPVTAKVTSTSADGSGWLEQGHIPVAFVQAEGQFKSALAQSGWTFRHQIALTRPNMRNLYTWKRGKKVITLMLWRIDVGKTGFSWGVSAERK